MKTLFFILAFLSCQASQYELCVCAIFKNEDRFLKEWIDYNRLIGVEHFWLYNNDSSDNYEAVLQPYIDQGIVELFYWPNTTPEVQFAFGCQAAAFQDALERAKQKTTWLAFIDVDEFIVPKNEYNLTRLLNTKFKHECGVVVYWQKFGTSHVSTVLPNELMTEKLTLKAQENDGCNLWFKSIVKVKYATTILNPHGPEYVKGKKAVNTLKQKIEFESEKKLFTTHLIQLNHYWTRDEDFFNNVKCARYLGWDHQYNIIIEEAAKLNCIEDTEIQKFVPMLKLLNRN